MDRFHETLREWRQQGIDVPPATQVDVAGNNFCFISDLEDIVRRRLPPPPRPPFPPPLPPSSSSFPQLNGERGG